MLAGFFLKKVVFSFSESGLFFSFSLFFVLTCCKLGALDFIILLRFHSNRIIQTRIFPGFKPGYLRIIQTRIFPPQRPPPPRPSPPWSPPPRPPPPRKRAAVAATQLRPPHPKFKPAYFVRVSCRKFKMIFKFGFFGLSALE